MIGPSHSMCSGSRTPIHLRFAVVVPLASHLVLLPICVRPHQCNRTEQDCTCEQHEHGQPRRGLRWTASGVERDADAPMPPSAERPKPTVECSANVAPRCVGVALALVPDVSAPLSAGTVRPYKRIKREQEQRGRACIEANDQCDRSRRDHDNSDGAVTAVTQRGFVSQDACR